MPRRLASPEARAKLRDKAKRVSDALATYRIELGKVTARSGVTVELDVRLPPEWYR